MTGWFHDYDTQDDDTWFPLGAGELNRSGNRLAALRAGGTMGEGYMARGTHNGIVIYDVHGFDRAPTRWPCWINDDAGGELTPPSWSPGRRLARLVGARTGSGPRSSTAAATRPRSSS